jgi:Spy/CpxP family protein refolding chaperone
MRGMKSTLVLVSVAIFLAASTAYAGPWGCSGCPGGPCGGLWAAKGAVWNELTKEQQKEITSLRTDLLKKMESVRSQVAQKRIEMLELASKDKPDEAAIQKLREKIWALRDSMRNERRAMGTKVRSILTPEQKKKLGPFGLGVCPGGWGGRRMAGAGGGVF